MVSKWFGWWNSLALLGCVEYIRGKGGWEVVGVEWLLVKFMTGNFSSGYF